MLRRAQPLLGTLVEIACGTDGAQTGGGQSTLMDASQVAFARVARVHALMSAHESASDLCRFNAAPPGQWVEVAPETLAVFGFALQLSAQTGGVFDVCATGPLDRRGFWHDIDVDASASRLCKRSPLRADLSGVAKGYAVDQAIDALRLAGVARGWVNAGGDLRVFGSVSVPLLVRAPWDLSQTRECTRLQDRAAATSANYKHAAGAPPADESCVVAAVGQAEPCTPCLRHGVTSAVVAVQQSWTVTASTCIAADGLTKVVAATGNARHKVLAHYGAQTWIF